VAKKAEHPDDKRLMPDPAAFLGGLQKRAVGQIVLHYFRYDWNCHSISKLEVRDRIFGVHDI
jgi:hypothetical protein